MPDNEPISVAKTIGGEAAARLMHAACGEVAKEMGSAASEFAETFEGLPEKNQEFLRRVARRFLVKVAGS